jgi:hypothetical protein
MTKEQITAHPAWNMLSSTSDLKLRYQTIDTNKSLLEEKWRVKIEYWLFTELPKVPVSALSLSVQNDGMSFMAVFLTEVPPEFNNTWHIMDTAPRNGIHIIGRYYDNDNNDHDRRIYWSTNRCMAVPVADNGLQGIEDGWIDVTTGEPIDEPSHWKHIEQP